MACEKPVFVKAQNMHVPCGACILCKKKKVSEWLVRLTHELEYIDHGRVYTLTYDTNHLPPNNSLSKRDVKLFLKVIRERIRTKQPYRQPLVHFLSGEYGGTTHRPHYHAIILGLTSADDPMIENAWGKGYTHADSVDEASIKYTVGYVYKKYGAENSLTNKILYKANGMQPPFQLQSNGIGKRWCTDNAGYLKQNGYLTIQGAKYAIPRAYRQWLRMPGDLAIAHIKEEVDKIDDELVKRGITPESMGAKLAIMASNKQKAMNFRAKQELFHQRNTV